jgi:hypothetical protein
MKISGAEALVKSLELEKQNCLWLSWRCDTSLYMIHYKIQK